MSAFARYSPLLREGIVARLGWSALRPVQEESSHALLDGRNAIVLAPTAGGKTEASMFPALSIALDEQLDGLSILYIAPIKALLNNQAERLGGYTQMVGLDRFVWHGDVTAAHKKRFVRQPCALLMTTPESLEVMLISTTVPCARLFAGLRMVVIDEVHALAGTDRGAHLISVLERVIAHSRFDVQRVGLSATVGNPEAIGAWLQGSSARPRVVIDPPRPPARRQLLACLRPDPGAVGRDAATLARGAKSLVFCESRAMAEAVAGQIGQAGVQVFVHHSAVSREERARAEAMFHGGEEACIVCTSTLELGIDVGDLDRVVQVDSPDSVSSFLQRMGRTGRRAGQVANTTFLCEDLDAVIQAAALVELARAGWVEDAPVLTRCWPVLIHQLLAMALASGGVSFETAWAHLSRVPDLAGIHRAEAERLVAFLVREEALVLTGGALVLGPAAERRYGRRNFMELFAVFSAPRSYAVVTGPGHAVGTLTQEFVDQLMAGESCFLLGGRAWSVVFVHHGERRVVVEPAAGGKRPTWGGALPQFLSMEVCQAMRAVLASDAPLAYLDPRAASALAERRELMGPVFAAGGVERDEAELRWWTYAGGRINATLRYALEAAEPGWRVIPDNFGLKIRGEGVTHAAFEQARARLERAELWEDAGLWRRVGASLPDYRLSKFQPLMPPWVAQEVVAGFLLDVEGAWRWLGAAVDARQTASAADALRDAPALRPIARSPDRALVWVDSAEGLVGAARALEAEQTVGLDVETTLKHRTLCLVQIAGATTTYLIDALAVPSLEPLRSLLAAPHITKLIHNAAFERGVLAQHDLSIEGVVDTLEVSRRVRGRGAEGGHSLKAACARELGLDMSKVEQTSDWSVRPLTASQIEYAALDAEVLRELWAALGFG